MTKTILMVAAGVLALSGNAAVAQTKADMARITCGELSQLYVEEFVVIGSWMSGYYNAKRNNTVIDIKQVGANAQKVSEFCKNNPKVTLMKAIERLSTAKN